jgi:predicted transcriptional regulator of viral defense system
MRQSEHRSTNTREPVLPGLFRARDLDRLGLTRGRFRSMLRADEIERISRGLYRWRAAKSSELETVAAVCALAPNAVVCLLTALVIHEIGTQLPRQVWIALDVKARKPRFGGLPVRVVRFSGAGLRYGITTREVLGVTIRITSPARTVVDCFRYRNKIGIDVAIEALRDVLRSRKATVSEIMRAAEMCRARTVMRTYLEAIVT